MSATFAEQSLQPNQRLFQVISSNPANPAGTTSTTGVMAGLARLITPQISGRVAVTIMLDGANNTVNDGVAAQIRQGTGSAPANGAALTGTTFGTSKQCISTVATIIYGFALQAVITGLAIGTQIWIDLSETALVGGTGTLTNIDVILEEF